MSRFIESIKIQDGQIMNLEYHMSRFNNTRLCFFPGLQELELGRWIHIPDECGTGLFKCRIIYGEEIEKIEFIPYKQRVITSLKLVFDNDIEYSFKYENRYALNELWEQRENNDDVIIVKHNLVTDSTYSNLVFLKEGIWYTPRHPLLKGTMRNKLVSQDLIKESDIHVDRILEFEKIALINAMIELGECLVDIHRIR